MRIDKDINIIYLANISTKQLICEDYVWTCVDNVGNIPCDASFVDIKIGDMRYGIHGQCGCDR